jgi:hypothetical protein
MNFGRIRLARAWVPQGNTAKARTAYQDFVMLWKDSDLHISVLITAKSEYPKLQSLLTFESRA